MTSLVSSAGYASSSCGWSVNPHAPGSLHISLHRVHSSYNMAPAVSAGPICDRAICFSIGEHVEVECGLSSGALGRGLKNYRDCM